MATRMLQRRGTASQWTDANPVLASGEIGFETTSGQFKVGDGVTAWASLPYFKDTLDLDITGKAPLASPTFTGTVALPSDTSIGNVSASEIAILNGLTTTTTELNYVDGVTSSVQTQLNAKLPLSGGTMTGKITLDGDPSQAHHAATKAYVDNTASGIVAKPQVLGATTANIDATYNNGTAGVGATLTHNSNGVFPPQAGGANGWALGKGILVKNQTNKAENGRYYISDMGSVSTPYVLTRCEYCDEADEIPGAYIFVQAGTSAGTGWVQTVADATTFVVGTDDINVVQFSGAGNITAGTNIEISGNEVSTVDDPEFTDITVTGSADFTGATVTGIGALPDQNGNSGKFLTTDGTDASWEDSPTFKDLSASSMTLIGQKEFIANVVSSAPVPITSAIFETSGQLTGGTGSFQAGYIYLYSDNSGVFSTSQQNVVNYIQDVENNPEVTIGIYQQGKPDNVAIIDYSFIIEPDEYEQRRNFALGLKYSKIQENYLGEFPTTITIGLPQTSIITDASELENSITSSHFSIGSTFFRKDNSYFPPGGDSVLVFGTYSFTSSDDVEQYSQDSSNFTYVNADGTGGTITPTEWSYIDGITSPIQTQLNSKASLSGANFSGPVKFRNATKQQTNWSAMRLGNLFGKLILNTYGGGNYYFYDSSDGDQTINISGAPGGSEGSGSSPIPLADVMNPYESVEVTIFSRNSFKPSLITGVLIDDEPYPVLWEGGNPTRGTSYGYDKYVFRIVYTPNDNPMFQVFGSMAPIGNISVPRALERTRTKTAIIQDSPPATITYELSKYSDLLYNNPATSSFDIDFTYKADTTLDETSGEVNPINLKYTVTLGESFTAMLRFRNGFDDFYGLQSISVDGVPRAFYWENGTYPSYGADSSLNVYTFKFTVVYVDENTGDANYDIVASRESFSLQQPPSGGGGGGGSDARLKSDILPLELP